MDFWAIFFLDFDSKKPEFFGGFWRRKIPEKITFQGCSPTGGKFGRFFLMMQAFLFGNFLGRFRWNTPENI